MRTGDNPVSNIVQTDHHPPTNRAMSLTRLFISLRKCLSTFPALRTRAAFAMALSALSIGLLHGGPVPVDGNGYFHLNSGQGPYVGYAPDTYNPAVQISLFVWMHGCGGVAEGDMYAVAPFATRANQSYVAISIGGRDGACWNTNVDAPKVLAAIADISRYFNINPRKIYLGGYSSGGDLTYRVGFENAELFAGLLAENSDPFRDTGSTGPALMAAATWKINVAHLAHTEDDVYPIAGVRANLATLTANGFPVAKIEKAGHHYDNSDFVAGTGTDYDRIAFLLPYLDAGWTSPAVLPPRVSTAKTKLTTGKSKITLRGTAKLTTRVEFKFGKGKFQKIKGATTAWKLKLDLKPGRNVVLIRGMGPGGTTSRLKIVIKRKG
jgi:hypothetical protein